MTDHPHAGAAAAKRQLTPLEQRRKHIAKLNLDFTETDIPPGSMGLALSGGGIRSATISLGFVQAITRHKRLLDFDYLSTVSGGGYFGSFLRSLFVADSDRGRTGMADPLPDLDVRETQAFVEEVLSYDAKQELIDDPILKKQGKAGKIRNPIWWLREHGRYLAPNGPTDYGFAIAYLVRNWVALLYTFTIAAAAMFLVLLACEWALLCCWPKLIAFLHWGDSPARYTFDLRVAIKGHAALDLVSKARSGWCLSPLLVLPPLFLFFSLCSGAAYWLTVSLRTGNAWLAGAGKAKQRDPVAQFWLQWLLILALTAVATALFCIESGVYAAGWAGAVDHMRTMAAPWWFMPFGIVLALTALIVAVPVAIWTATGASGDAFTNELRRRFTALGAALNQWAVVTLVLALIDTLALALLGPGRAWLLDHRLAGLFAALVPAAAWLISKVPQWFAGGTLVKFLGEHVWTVALIIGALLFGLVALGADIVVQWIAWAAAPWSPATGIAWTQAGSLGGAVLVLCVMTGSFSGFINLSSLFSLYAGRLTRAYLGASNIVRLRLAAEAGSKPITENDPKDYIDVSRYQQSASAAPIHLINATLNETHSRACSQLIDRDRKGVPIVFAPDGILVDPARAATLQQQGFFSWADLAKEQVESLSVGDLCAISGAAASSAMGSRTTLGGALAFTFANIRLGYWWAVRDLLPEAQTMNTRLIWRISVACTWPFRTYFYLRNEMIAAYSRENRRVYLTDGGHFENSGTYELLRRKARVIVTCDNGADPDFQFEDLEDLVRKARIDLGLSVTVAGHEQVEQLVGKGGATHFLNGDARGWRARAGMKGDTGCALLLEVHSVATDAARAEGYLHIEREGVIVWVKPRLFHGLPPDVTGYGERNPTFPQQTTGDQFFDEAQWESYRALGYSLGETLLGGSEAGIDLFRKLLPGAPPPPPVRKRRSTSAKPPHPIVVTR
ncbi:hypothetical protein HZF05_14375 [Sphingomonas sp. CGMCC 1.13654]|uniref:PNPLA domain-containing protein n=1 Tax=Sphingomonas chungangi TaxID=2683589 RepID=A0A838L8M8_9SPHN|nr:hypothetical protein [Sphingomonas chungangi]MBA2935270.1 hypothetical protein [Sphingomonas chungangi]MVW56777.1 hypothetical protein [Sphingomonas chungangi]